MDLRMVSTYSNHIDVSCPHCGELLWIKEVPRLCAGGLPFTLRGTKLAYASAASTSPRLLCLR